MKRLWRPMILVIIGISLSAVAANWTELEWSANVVSDHKTGLPAVIFSTGLKYDEHSEATSIHIAWEVFRVDGGLETMLYEYSRTATARSQTTYFASEAVVIEAGSRYGARIRIEDSDNNLSYERTFSHIEPHSLPVGLRFVGWDGTEEADLAAMSDADIGELVSVKNAIASYEVIAENVDISALFPSILRLLLITQCLSFFSQTRASTTTGDPIPSQSQ